MYGYIKQHDKEADQDIIYLLDIEIFQRMLRSLDLDINADFIEVVNGELIGGISYNFTMKNGTKFLMAGDAFVSIIVPKMKKPEEAPEDLPNIGTISTKILIHFHEGGAPYHMSPEALVELMQTRYDVRKSSEQILNIIANLSKEGYINRDKQGRLFPTKNGAEVGRVLAEGRRKKGSPTPPPKKEEAPSDSPPEVARPNCEDCGEPSDIRQNGRNLCARHANEETARRSETIKPLEATPETFIYKCKECGTVGKSDRPLEPAWDAPWCGKCEKSRTLVLVSETTKEPRVIKEMTLEHVALTEEGPKAAVSFTQSSDETHKAIMTILEEAKIDGEPVTSLVQMGEDAGYLAREVVLAIVKEWPEALKGINAITQCHACIFPLETIKEICPACGAMDHMSEADIEDKFETDIRYWDCDCMEDYIHPKSQVNCPECRALREERPDSRVNEVKAMEDRQRATEVEEILPDDLEAAADKFDQLSRADESLSEAILRIANTLEEPFQRTDIGQALTNDIVWKSIDITKMNKELELLVEEAALYHDGKGFRVTVRDSIPDENSDEVLETIEEDKPETEKKSLGDMADMF